MSKWEYECVVRRHVESPEKQSGQWDWDKQVNLVELGDQGWELVTVVTRSTRTGENWAGVTTEENWMFKRPKKKK